MCVYKTADGVCRNFSDAVHTSYCVEGPCRHDKPSNADRIRAMSDEELAKAIVEWQKTDPSIKWCKDDYGCAALGEDFECTDELQTGCILRWLSQPAEED